MIEPSVWGGLYDSFRGYLLTSSQVEQGSITTVKKVNRLIDQFSALTNIDYTEFRTEIQVGMGMHFIDVSEYRGNMAAFNGRIRNDFPLWAAASDVRSRPLSPPSSASPVSIYNTNTNLNRNDVYVEINQEIISYINQQLTKPLTEKERSFFQRAGEAAKNSKDIVGFISVVVKLAHDHQIDLTELARLFSLHVR